MKKLIPENEHFTFAEWVDFIHHRQKEVNAAMKDASKEKKTTWGDVSHCWELEYREGLEEKDLLPLAPGYRYETAKVLASSGKYSTLFRLYIPQTHTFTCPDPK